MTGMRKAPTIEDVKLKKTNIWVSVTHWKELRALSRKTLIPVSALIRKAIAEFLERQRKSPRR
jgi:post-segregation antitoxin (ccd killing protein)